MLDGMWLLLRFQMKWGDRARYAHVFWVKYVPGTIPSTCSALGDVGSNHASAPGG